jgi:hypothetical protein
VDLEQLAKEITTSFGLCDYEDPKYFFYRFCKNKKDYKKYDFHWEPFRDLAGPLEKSEHSLPILVLSLSEKLERPEVRLVKKPISHYEMRISPNLSAGRIANAWLELLSDNGAQYGIYKGPFDWFLEKLEITPNDLSIKSRKFLLIE